MSDGGLSLGAEECLTSLVFGTGARGTLCQLDECFNVMSFGSMAGGILSSCVHI